MTSTRFQELVTCRVAVLVGVHPVAVWIQDGRYVACQLSAKQAATRRFSHFFGQIKVPYRRLASVEDTAQNIVTRIGEEVELLDVADLARRLG